MKTHVDLFSGIGGFALAAHWAGFRTKIFCERDDFCQKVLGMHWPNVPVISDIHDFDGREYAGADLLTGGFPCQPYSCAGKRLGHEDDRALWPEMLRIIAEVRPSWIVAENVAGFINLALDDVLSDLEKEGYEVGTLVLPACAVNAPHRRDRVWIVAHANVGTRQHQQPSSSQRSLSGCDEKEDGVVADSNRARFREQRSTLSVSEKQFAAECGGDASDSNSESLGWIAEPWGECGGRQFEPSICGIFDGISYRLDECGLRNGTMGYSVSGVYQDAKTETIRSNQVLRGLRTTTAQETLRQEFGGQNGIQQKEILQSTVHGRRNDARPSNAGRFKETSGNSCREGLRKLRNDQSAASPPYGFESSEQRIIEHHDVMRCLSRFMALETWKSSESDMCESIAMYRLRQGIAEIMAGYVPETLSEIQKIWRSFDDETMEWIALRISTGDPFCRERPDIPRVSARVPNRSYRLKALGNAIVPQVAYEIIMRIPA